MENSAANVAPPSPAAGPWREAETLHDLLQLARAFVLGEIDTFPGWGGDSMDDESDALEGTLLAAGAAGMLTVASQPGGPFAPGHDGRHWGGRAFLGGLLEPARVEALRARAQGSGLWLFVETPEPGPSFSVPVGLRDGTPYLILESGARAAELEIFEAALGRRAYAELARCALVWVIDPVWGRRDRLPRLFLT